jgi:Uma2 family endonuclease
MAVQLEQSAEITPYQISLEEYERMCEAGVFAPEARIELIRGVIVAMAPIGPEHEASVAYLTNVFVRLVGDAGWVWPQGNGVQLPQSQSRPQPDITVLRRRDDYYRRGTRPMPQDVLLLVEVAESSLKYDRGAKRKLYAEAGIAEYWVVNLVKGVVEVYTDPREGKYQSVRTVRRGEMLPLPGGLGSIAVAEVLG